MKAETPIERQYVIKRAKYIRRARILGINHPFTLETEQQMADLEDRLIQLDINPDSLD